MSLQLQQQIKAQKATLNERNLDIKTKQTIAADKYFKVPQSGTLISFDVKVGEVINANTSFGELAPTGSLVIEGELDEYYADKISIGQEVAIVLVGQANTIATGTISYVGTSLQNKSIL